LYTCNPVDELRPAWGVQGKRCRRTGRILPEERVPLEARDETKLSNVIQMVKYLEKTKFSR
jgi:hypothetical protein